MNIFAAILALGLFQVPAISDSTIPDNGLKLTPPPGWSIKPPDTAHPESLFVLQGPRHHSFVLTAIRGRVDFDNRKAVEGILSRLIERIAQASGLPLTPTQKLQSLSLPNGVRADYLVASSPGRPLLLVGLCRFEGRILIANLVSNIPESMLPAILLTLQSDPGPSATGNGPPDLRTGNRARIWLLLSCLTLLAILGSALWVARKKRRD